MKMESKHHGAHSELIACKWLLEHGYDVFRNVSVHGFADIIAVNFVDGENKVYLIDVKSGSWYIRKNGDRVPQFAHVKNHQKGILTIVVMDNDQCFAVNYIQPFGKYIEGVSLDDCFKIQHELIGELKHATPKYL